MFLFLSAKPTHEWPHTLCSFLFNPKPYNPTTTTTNNNNNPTNNNNNNGI